MSKSKKNKKKNTLLPAKRKNQAANKQKDVKSGTLKLKLLSDAQPGSGEGVAGFVNTDVAFDRYGIPYIPAKRIKGILRESAHDLKDTGCLESNIDKIFGKTGSDMSCSFKISNGRHVNSIAYENLLRYIDSNQEMRRVFNTEAVLDFFTYVRSQTAIEKDGVAKDGSLRTGRVLRKKLEFVFDVEYEVSHEEDLIKIAKVTRFFGVNRTRGLGHIELSFEPEKNQSKHSSADLLDNPTRIKDDTECFIKYYIRNLSQILVTVRVGGEQYSERFIPGSFILGAFARRYIKNKGGKDVSDDVDFRNLFVSGKVTFTNAYPEKDKQIFFPSPLSVVKEKDYDNYCDLIHNNVREDLENDELCVKGNLKGYSTVEDSCDSNFFMPHAQVEYHHQRPADRSIGRAREINGVKEGEFYQLEVISPGQSFAGEIRGKYKYLKLLKLEKNMTLYIGKSKTAQYGKIEISFDGIKTIQETQEDWKNGDSKIFMFVSDAIFLNEFGFACPDCFLFAKEFAKFLDISENDLAIPKEDEIELSFLNQKLIGGYMGVWNLPKAQTPAISAGSIVFLQNNSGKDLRISVVRGKVLNEFGIRTEEGYGQVMLYPDGEREFIPVSQDNQSAFATNGNTEDLIKFVLENRIKTKLRNKSLKCVMEYVKHQEDKEEKRRYPTSSFISRLLAIINSAKVKSFAELEDEFNKLRDSAIKQIRKIQDYTYLSVTRIKIDNNYKQQIIINKQKFTDDLKGIADSASISSLRGILEETGISDTFFIDNENIFFLLFRQFMLDYLTFLKYKIRGQNE